MANTTKILTNLMKSFRQVLAAPATDQDPMFLNTVFFRAGEMEIQLRRLKNEKEAGRKTRQFEIRDELMKPEEEGGQGMSKTAAENEARSDQRYLDYLAELEEIAEALETAELLKDVAKQRAWLARDERQWLRQNDVSDAGFPEE